MRVARSVWILTPIDTGITTDDAMTLAEAIGLHVYRKGSGISVAVLGEDALLDLFVGLLEEAVDRRLKWLFGQ